MKIKWSESERMNMKVSMSESEGAVVSATTMQASAMQRGSRDWIARSIWTERMLAALDNGVKGNKWFSLMDKVARGDTLQLAWQKVVKNKGAAGVDRQSVEKFAARAEVYLAELELSLKRSVDENRDRSGINRRASFVFGSWS